ncbi:hypothetical protein CAEBREN_11275 [Caenorhabditis brenneri]|uniref:F-box domain-containing protein n=1 Tax=Caenorhabditis brenneri TaxID=135651 RepID=G0M9L0_CAEBE|nr:hypothetical protein CAEBREN_11275 [Caenorhabditis brenneri]
MSALPFLLFPLLVIQEIFNEMCPLALINLSLAGKRTRNLIKMMFARNSGRYLTIDIGEGYEITLQEELKAWIFLIKENHSKKRKMEYLFCETSYISSQNPLEEFENLLKNLQNVYSCKIGRVTMNMDTFPLQNQGIVNVLKCRQESFETFTVFSGRNADSDLKYLFDHLEISRSLTIDALRIADSFEGNLPEILKEELHINNARFLKLDQLLKLQASRIWLQDTTLTSIEVNAFLKSWLVAESHLNLRQFEIGFRFGRLDDYDIMEGIPFDMVNGSVDSEIEIKRIDGRMARITATELGGVTTFEMLIFC